MTIKGRRATRRPQAAGRRLTKAENDIKKASLQYPLTILALPSTGY